jgi:hypothetical protein
MKADDQDFVHTHVWGPERRRDYCHYVIAEHQCKTCPATTRTTFIEARDFAADPLSIAFADPSCAECRALLRGNEPAFWRTPTLRENQDGRQGQEQEPTRRGQPA